MTKKKPKKKQEEEFLTIAVGHSLAPRALITHSKKAPKIVTVAGKKYKVHKGEWLLVSDIESVTARSKYARDERVLDLLCPSGDILKKKKKKK